MMTVEQIRTIAKFMSADRALTFGHRPSREAFEEALTDLVLFEVISAEDAQQTLSNEPR